MIYLQELLNSIGREEKNGILPIERWDITDVEHLMHMGFEMVDDHNLQLKNPDIVIYIKQDKDEDGRKRKIYYMTEKGRAPKQFRSFNDIIEYFAKYEQPNLDMD